jgi:hypothetical protein
MDWNRRDKAVDPTKPKLLPTGLIVKIYKNLVYAETIREQV